MSAFQEANAELSEATPVKLGLLVLIVGLVGGGLAGSIWWASKTSSQLENIQALLMHLQVNDTNQQKDIVDLQAQVKVLNASGSPQLQILSGKVVDLSERLRMIETQGSPAVISRLTQAEAALTKVREDLEIHKATGKP